MVTTGSSRLSASSTSRNERRWILPCNRHTSVDHLLDILLVFAVAYIIDIGGFDTVLPGSITFVQTFGSAINLNVHFHALVPDGVFIDTPVEQPITFLELPFITQAEVESLLVKIARRVMRFASAKRITTEAVLIRA